MRKISCAKRKMLKEWEEPKGYSSEKLRKAYETKTEWVSKVQKRKE